MDSLHAIFASIGAQISPLSGLDDVASFFLAAAASPPDATHRAVTIAQWLGGGLANAASMLISTLDSIRGMPRVQKILAVLPPTENMELGTVCDDGKLGPASFGRPNESDNIIRLLCTTHSHSLERRRQERAPVPEGVLVLPRSAPPHQTLRNLKSL